MKTTLKAAIDAAGIVFCNGLHVKAFEPGRGHLLLVEADDTRILAGVDAGQEIEIDDDGGADAITSKGEGVRFVFHTTQPLNFADFPDGEATCEFAPSYRVSAEDVLAAESLGARITARRAARAAIQAAKK